MQCTVSFRPVERANKLSPDRTEVQSMMLERYRKQRRGANTKTGLSDRSCKLKKGLI